MSKFGLVVVWMLMAGGSYAQDYFVFIQADNNQPFYVRLGEQVYSSSAGGHLILSQLKDSIYSMVIGRPGQASQERRYIVVIHQRDQEFRLKDEGEKGWGLYDEQAKEMKMPEPADRVEEVRPPGLKKDDAFSRLMAGVVQDTAVLYNTYAMERSAADSAVVVKADSGVRDVKMDLGAKGMESTAMAEKTNPGAMPVVTTGIGSDTLARAPAIVPPVRDPSRGSGVRDMAGILPPADTSRGAAGVLVDSAAADPGSNRASAGAKPVGRSRGVVKLGERKLSRSVRMAFADRSAGVKADTVVLFIPIDTPAVVKGSVKPVRMADSGRMAIPRSHGPNPDSPLLGKGQNSGSVHSAVGVQAAEATRPRPADTPRKSAEAKSSLPFVNSDCHNYATDYDVDKLRIKLLEASRDEDKVVAARKVFKTRCFATRQIRALSEVFSSDAGKYRFFEAAYPFCSDDQFRELGSLLTDPVYSGKFWAMVGR